MATNPSSLSQLNWPALLPLSNAELAQQDIAAVNLACAVGLPGTETIEIPAALKLLDRWAERVFDLTQRSPWFLQNPAKYDNSFNLFRIHVLFSVLSREFGFYYSPNCIPENATPRPIDTFIHGLLQGSGGNCASLPVIFIAVGRRLGYPLKLVKAKLHYFARWDEPEGERFNIEVSQRQGSFDCYSDDHYRNWPHPIAPEREAEGSFLISLSPWQELAAFLNERGFCWRWLENYQAATEAFLQAKMMEPDNRYYGTWLATALKDWREHLQAQLPPNFPQVTFVASPQRRYPPELVPLAYERQLLSLQTLQNLLDEPEYQRWWQLLRQHPNARPKEVTRQIIHKFH